MDNVRTQFYQKTGGMDMKLTQKDKELLLGWGYSENDIPQIEEAMKASKTKYEYQGKAISRDMSIELLGRERYLSGISRSAFHYSASREVVGGGSVHFDSSNLFRHFGAG